MNHGNFSPFYGDLIDPVSIITALEKFQKEGAQITDVVLCAAGGLDKYNKEKARGLDDKAAVEKARSYARMVNFEGPKIMLGHLMKTFPTLNRFIYISSTSASNFQPSTQHDPLSPYDELVAFYKYQFEKYLEDEAKNLKAKNIYPAIITAGTLQDTLIVQRMREADPHAFLNSEEKFLTTWHVAAKVMKLLVSDPTTWGEYPKREKIG
ncbi:hypothetical protein HY029_02150 [Candidatus Gottesmanbacteria bacterium]|nr:hypothetical protein [Candidatus Gottesmanbacteria bacterium]